LHHVWTAAVDLNIFFWSSYGYQWPCPLTQRTVNKSIRASFMLPLGAWCVLKQEICDMHARQSYRGEHRNYIGRYISYLRSIFIFDGGPEY
jgi:hypothetical protein